MEEKLLVIQEPFKWLEVLTDLAKGAELSTWQKTHLDSRSGDWWQCACGELCKALPRNPGGTAPGDDKLSTFGVMFCVAITRKEWGLALWVYHRIEKRTERLLNEMGVTDEV